MAKKRAESNNQSNSESNIPLESNTDSLTEEESNSPSLTESNKPLAESSLHQNILKWSWAYTNSLPSPAWMASHKSDCGQA